MTAAPVARVVFDPEQRAERASLYADGEIEVTGRGSGRVAPGRSVSFAAYFNAFPAWHWHEYTPVREVVLAIELVGVGTLSIHRSDASGASVEVDRRPVPGALDATIRIDLGPNSQGGWIWFDLEAGVGGLELKRALWQVDAAARDVRRASLSMTTMDKSDFALGVLRQIATEPAALAALDEVIVVDQGRKKVADDPGFASTSAALTGRLRLIEQANLGGSGGFARGMLEVLDAGRAGSVILLDDDVELEPESIARAVAFSSYTTVPTIVGGHFFDLYRPTQLHAFSEVVTFDEFEWGPVGPTRHDFSDEPLRRAAWLHEPARPDYNGWWFCLIPVEALRGIGLSLPAFLKWDDAEYGLRARAAGIPTVSLPGMAVWHISWVDKNDALGWQAFFHARNRLLAALVDERGPGRRLPRRNLDLDIRYLLTMDYHVVELRHLAYESILAGPLGLHGELGTRLAAVLATMREYPSGRPVALEEGAPHPMSTGLPEDEMQPLRGNRLRLEVIRDAIVQWWTPARAVPSSPEARLPHSEARWWLLARYRHVLALNSDGTAYQLHRLEPAAFRRMFLRAIRDWMRMGREWRRLGAEYRAARAGMVASETWRSTLGM